MKKFKHNSSILGMVFSLIFGTIFVSIGFSRDAGNRETGKTSTYDWPHWRGPDFNGISSEKGWRSDWDKAPPKQVWKASVGTGFSSMSVSKGRLYTMGNTENSDIIHCLDVNSGKVLWTHSYTSELDPKSYEGGPSATPTVDRDRVYTLGKAGDAYCLDAESGKVIWSKRLQDEVNAVPPRWGFAGSPLIVGNLVLVNVGASGVAINKIDGNVVWKSGQKGAGYATPVSYEIGNTKGVAIFTATGLTGVNPLDGKALWSFPWITSYAVNAADPIISQGKIFLSSGYNKGCALINTVGGKPKVVWQNKQLRNHFNSSVLWNGALYGIDGNSNRADTSLKCIEFGSGRLQWSQEGFGFGSLMIADGKMIILSESGELIIADASSAEYKEQARLQILGGKCWTVPVLSGGKIFARNARGDLVCLDVSGSD